jgi:hypothetical protein
MLPAHPRESNIGPGSEKGKGRSVCCDPCPCRRASLLTATTRLVSPIAVMAMIQATMMVIVAVVAIRVIAAVVIIISAMYTPMNSAVVAIVGLRLVHGQ